MAELRSLTQDRPPARLRQKGSLSPVVLSASMHVVLGTARTAPSALLAIAEEVIDEAARLRCWPNDCVCDAACCGAAADKDETHRFGSLRRPRSAT